MGRAAHDDAMPISKTKWTHTGRPQSSTATRPSMIHGAATTAAVPHQTSMALAVGAMAGVNPQPSALDKVYGEHKASREACRSLSSSKNSWKKNCMSEKVVRHKTGYPLRGSNTVG